MTTVFEIDNLNFLNNYETKYFGFKRKSGNYAVLIKMIEKKEFDKNFRITKKQACAVT